MDALVFRIVFGEFRIDQWEAAVYGPNEAENSK
jgi:hypothetical protein